MKFSAKGTEQEKFQSRVWAILMRDHKEVYRAALEQEADVDALIDMGNENGWDAQSIANAIVQGYSA